jgi:type II secretory pathway component PulK
MNLKNRKAKSAQNERGAALVSVLFISMLLVVTGGALVLATGLSTRTAVDATAEMQAYYAANLAFRTR